MATQASKWKKTTAPTDLTLPSGNVALCKRNGIDVFLRSGQIPNSLMPLMKSALVGKVPSISPGELDPEKIKDTFELIDALCCEVFVSPAVRPLPKDGEDKIEGDWLYVDEVEFADKEFVFHWAVGGTSDLAKFRAGQAGNVAAVQAIAEVQPAAEPSAGPQG